MHPTAAPKPLPAPAVATTRLLAVDGNSLGHRGFHSSRADAVDDARPLLTGAVISMLATVWAHGPYDAIVVAFDHPINRRKAEHPDYKANRPPAPPELRQGLQELRLHLGTCGFLVVEEEGAEADDLLASAADACRSRGWHCDLLSSDKDLTALVDATTRLLRPRATFSDLLIEDESEVRQRYGIEPGQYVDLAALRGDPSDGLAGAAGVGPKIAARLLRDHGSVANLYAALTDLPPRVEEALRRSRDQVERNLLLMAPIPHLEVDVDAAHLAGIDLDRVTGALEPLGLDAAARRFVRAVTSPVPPTPPPPTDPLEPVTGAPPTGPHDRGSHDRNAARDRDEAHEHDRDEAHEHGRGGARDRGEPRAMPPWPPLDPDASEAEQATLF